MPRPNVLWIFTDEQRTDSVGCYGSNWARTPTFDRLAMEGVQFNRAVTPAPVCVPARSSLLSGRYPSELGVWANDRGAARQSRPLVHAFEGAGYRTASFGKQHYLCWAGQAFQTEVSLVLSDQVDYFGYSAPWHQDEFDVVHYPATPYPWILAGRFPGNSAETAEAQVVAAAKAWLCEIGDRPFFLRVSFNGPHTPVVPPDPWDTLIDPEDIVLRADGPGEREAWPEWLRDISNPALSSRLDERQLNRIRQAYYGEVAYIDSLVGDLLSWLDDRGLLESLIVVFTSDHGTHLGDFGLVQKQTFFDPVVCVPFIFWAPGAIAPRDPVETPVETRGLLPSLLDLCVQMGDHELLSAVDACAFDFWSDSLARTLTDGSEPVGRPVFSEFVDSCGIRPEERLVMVRDGDWKLSVSLDPEPNGMMLFNTRTDPEESHDLSGTSSASAARDRLLDEIAFHIPSDGRELGLSLRRREDQR